MVIGNLKYLIGPVSGTISHPLGSSRFIFVRTYGCRVVGLCSHGRGVFRIHDLERKGKISVGGSEVDPHACGLGSPSQVEIRFRIVRLSRHEIAYLFRSHRVTSGTNVVKTDV